MPLATELGPKLPVLFHNVACVLVRTGDREGAIANVKAAFDHGYKDARAMRDDSDLASLVGDPAFDALFAAG